MVRMMANGAIILDPNTKTSKFLGNIFLVTKKRKSHGVDGTGRKATSLLSLNWSLKITNIVYIYI